MARMHLLTTLTLALWLLSPAAISRAQSREDATVRASTAVLDEIMAIPLKGIPARPAFPSGGRGDHSEHDQRRLRDRAFGTAKVCCSRADTNRNWQAPVFITLTGGNIGWQAGVQATDVVLVFQDAAERSRHPLGQVHARPLMPRLRPGRSGGQAAAATDGRLKAEIYTYSRSRGLFLGVAIDRRRCSRWINISNATYYRSPSPRPAGDRSTERRPTREPRSTSTAVPGSRWRLPPSCNSPVWPNSMP